jgi:hypothetical protein
MSPATLYIVAGKLQVRVPPLVKATGDAPAFVTLLPTYVTLEGTTSLKTVLTMGSAEYRLRPE